jgi:hypothetical protein
MAQSAVPVTVVVAFYSRCGSSETRALTAAVGAVNARALIRMRRVLDVDAAHAGVDVPACAEELARMRKEYVPPTEADILGADALILAVPQGFTASAPEWAPLLSHLSKLDADGKLRGKVAAVLSGGGGGAAEQASFVSLLHERGFLLAPPGVVDRVAVECGTDDASGLKLARAHGRRVAEICRTLKSAAH